MLGSLYFYGKGVEKDYIKAYAWCDLAQDGGNADAAILSRCCTAIDAFKRRCEGRLPTQPGFAPRRSAARAEFVIPKCI